MGGDGDGCEDGCEDTDGVEDVKSENHTNMINACVAVFQQEELGVGGLIGG